ncbi:MAG TPA: hypothetical protein VLH85_03250 [Levilinea sp.]|nr:hypothetical protein [Levilinea sp.]
MAWLKLSRISYMFPSGLEGSVEFFEHLAALLGRDTRSVIYEDLILLTPSEPSGALPETSFELAEIPIPKIVLDTDLPVDTRVANFYLHSSEVAVETPRLDFDAPGGGHALMPIAALVDRFNGDLRLDHSGLNFPVALYSQEEWQTLLRDISTVADVYQYPTGEEWYFLLPATPDEAGGGISHFPTGRAPKFELVYDQFAQAPVVQFQIETMLSRAEVEERLPEPYGISFPDLGDIFRTVYVEHPWSGLRIRFDMSFVRPGNDGLSLDEWLVKEGRRLVYAATKSSSLP